MKSFLLFLGLLYTHTFLSAQETVPKRQVNFFVSPTIAFRMLSENKTSDNHAKSMDVETVKPGFSLGILGSFAVHKKIRIQTGASFTCNGYGIKKHGPVSATMPGGRNPCAFRTVYHLYYINIPVQVKYTFIQKKKIRFYTVPGVEANVNTLNKITTTLYYEDGKQTRNTTKGYVSNGELQIFNCSVTTGIGIDFALSEKVALFVQPTFKYMIFPAADVPEKRRLYSIGLTTGITINRT